MRYNERLATYIGVPGQLSHNHYHHTLTFEDEAENSAWQGTLKEIGEDYAVIACRHLKETQDLLIPLGLLVIVEQSNEND